jgi:hypothetical protein
MFRYAEKTERKEYQGVRDIDLGLGWVAENPNRKLCQTVCQTPVSWWSALDLDLICRLRVLATFPFREKTTFFSNLRSVGAGKGFLFVAVSLHSSFFIPRLYPSRYLSLTLILSATIFLL